MKKNNNNYMIIGLMFCGLVFIYSLSIKQEPLPILPTYTKSNINYNYDRYTREQTKILKDIIIEDKRLENEMDQSTY